MLKPKIMVVQKIQNSVGGPFDLAYKYFSIISALNNLNLVKRDLQLLAYSLERNLPINEIKDDFVEGFNTSLPTVGNIISKLYKLNVLQKDKRIVFINPVFLKDFNEDMLIAITFKHGDKG